MSLKCTPLYEEHLELGAKMAPFGGWDMPIQYQGIIAEHNWTRSSCSIFDICHMGELVLRGDYLKSNFDKIVTINLKNMPAGSCRYGFMLNDKGGIIDDLVVYRFDIDKWMIVVNAATLEKDEAHLRKNLSSDCYFENISGKAAKLDLQGPLSAEVLKACINEDVRALKYFHHAEFDILGDKNIISRTGYTGELGFEIYINSEKVVELWKALLNDKRVKPAALGARDTLRLEMAYSLYGQDIDENTTPLEADLEHFVYFEKDFIGKDALIKQKAEGLKRKLCCFKLDSRKSPRHGHKIQSGWDEIGEVTSGSFSPTLSCGIGMGYIKTEHAKIGDAILLSDGKTQFPAAVVEKPFYKQGSIKKEV